jgi:SMC interacting uncharacterized protein involved in chromosome segregation
VSPAYTKASEDVSEINEQYERVQCQRMDAGMVSETYEEFLERRVEEGVRHFQELQRAAVEYLQDSNNRAYLTAVLQNYGALPIPEDVLVPTAANADENDDGADDVSELSRQLDIASYQRDVANENYLTRIEETAAKIERLQADIVTLTARNRALQEERDSLRAKVDALTAAVDAAERAAEINYAEWQKALGVVNLDDDDE